MTNLSIATHTIRPIEGPLLGGRLNSKSRAAIAVIGFALLTAVLAQVKIPLGITPVPITGQTFAVLLAGGALGARLGSLSQVVYVAMGAVGLPFYSDAQGGWSAATGTTAGYLAGFVVAAFVVGRLADRGQNRNVLTAMSTFALGSVIIYAFGATYLAYRLDLPLSAAAGEPSALAFGVTPFLIGDAVKVVLAGLALPLVHAVLDDAD